MKRPDDSNPASISYRLRKRRFALIDQLLHEIVGMRGYARVLDVGGRPGYWTMMDPALRGNVSVTVLNVSTDLGHTAPSDGPEIVEVEGDGCAMPEFENHIFDLTHSNSVIEHVGSLENMARFARETTRVGRGYYHQTPNLWFPLEPHYGVPFVHWLPGPVRARLLHQYKLGYANRVANYECALRAVDHTEIVNAFLMKKLFPDAELYRERFLLLTKSLICFRRASRSARPEQEHSVLRGI